MSTDEIATLLALPTPACEALAKCAGPGWYVRDGHEAVGALRYGGGMANPGAWAWCPCDTADILVEVVIIVSDYARLEMCGDDMWRARCGSSEATGGSARLAALRLLGRVSA